MRKAAICCITGKQDNEIRFVLRESSGEKNDQLENSYHSSMNAADWSMRWTTTTVRPAAEAAAAAKVHMHEPFS